VVGEFRRIRIDDTEAATTIANKQKARFVLNDTSNKIIAQRFTRVWRIFVITAELIEDGVVTHHPATIGAKPQHAARVLKANVQIVNFFPIWIVGEKRVSSYL